MSSKSIKWVGVPSHKTTPATFFYTRSSNFATMTVAHEVFPTHNDFRSDTFTVPTALMNNAVVRGLSEGWLQVGDSVYKEDEQTLKLEKLMRDLTGKEAALFCPSGTMSNQIGLRANLFQPPYSILCDYRAHIFMHEAAGTAMLSQAMVHPITPANGNYLTVEDIEDHFVPSDGDIHAAPTKLISLENTCHGIVTPYHELEKISQFARDNNIRLHLDGARIINASVATGVPLDQYCKLFDSVSICLSKSAGAPMGSVLVGDQTLINTANHFKKQCGGGIRQGGIMAFMAIRALEENICKIDQSHKYAKEVGKFCEDHDIHLESPVDTNFVFLDLKKNNMNDQFLVSIAEKYGLRLMGKRLAFHFQISNISVQKLKIVLLECKQEALRNPFHARRGPKKLYNIDVVKANLVKALFDRIQMLEAGHC